jgi:Zn-dependent protease
MILLEPPRTAWDLKLALLRIPVRIHPLFWVGALILSYSRSDPFGLVLAKVGCVLLSLLVHEFGHALCGRCYGDRQNHVVLYFCYGVCVSERDTQRHWPRIHELLWGPGAGFVLAALVFGLRWAAANKYVALQHPYWDEVLEYTMWVNVIWGALNLIPVFPLDGGQIMREILLWKTPRRAERLAFTASFYIALIVAVGGVVLHFTVGGYALSLAVLFAILAFSNWDLLRQLRAYGGMDGDDEPRQPWEQDPDWWKK